MRTRTAIAIHNRLNTFVSRSNERPEDAANEHKDAIRNVPVAYKDCIIMHARFEEMARVLQKTPSSKQNRHRQTLHDDGKCDDAEGHHDDLVAQPQRRRRGATQSAPPESS